MGRKRNFGRAVSGVVVLDKPEGVTSNGLLQRAKRVFFANKAGHTGSLDPLATGVLPICLGEATKFSQYLLDSDKTYLSTFKLGQSTDTADADGKVIEENDATLLVEAAVRKAMQNYEGLISQVPPMYSALKHKGQPLYKLARKGETVEIKPRNVTIYAYELLAFRSGLVAEADVKVHCSKGTYIRSLATDLGRDLGVGGHVSALRRIQAGPYSIEQAHRIETLESERGESEAQVLDPHLLNIDSGLMDLSKIDLDENSAFYFLQGQPVMDSRVYRLGGEGDTIRVFDENARFLGIARITDEGTLAPKRLINYD